MGGFVMTELFGRAKARSRGESAALAHTTKSNGNGGNEAVRAAYLCFLHLRAGISDS
jgi:hypothetical protein